MVAGRISDRTLEGWMEKTTLGSRGPVTCIDASGAWLWYPYLFCYRAFSRTLSTGDDRTPV
jgi:hypothetical protein